MSRISDEQSVDYSALGKRYGLDWNALDRTEWQAHAKSLELLAAGAVGQLGGLLAEPTRPFLPHPPAAEQRRVIDEGESLETAKVSLELQDVIARIPIEESFEPFVCLQTVSRDKQLDWQFELIWYLDLCCKRLKNL